LDRLKRTLEETRRQQDTYADTGIPYLDAKVSAALCKGGPIAYAVDPRSGVSDSWIREHVLPHSAAALPTLVANLFGRAVL
jgi:hypothetical protein